MQKITITGTFEIEEQAFEQTLTLYEAGADIRSPLDLDKRSYFVDKETDELIGVELVVQGKTVIAENLKQLGQLLDLRYAPDDQEKHLVSSFQWVPDKDYFVRSVPSSYLDGEYPRKGDPLELEVKTARNSEAMVVDTIAVVDQDGNDVVFAIGFEAKKDISFRFEGREFRPRRLDVRGDSIIVESTRDILRNYLTSKYAYEDSQQFSYGPNWYYEQAKVPVFARMASIIHSNETPDQIAVELID